PQAPAGSRGEKLCHALPAAAPRAARPRRGQGQDGRAVTGGSEVYEPGRNEIASASIACPSPTSTSLPHRSTHSTSRPVARYTYVAARDCEGRSCFPTVAALACPRRSSV